MTVSRRPHFLRCLLPLMAALYLAVGCPVRAAEFNGASLLSNSFLDIFNWSLFVPPNNGTEDVLVLARLSRYSTVLLDVNYSLRSLQFVSSSGDALPMRFVSTQGNVSLFIGAGGLSNTTTVGQTIESLKIVTTANQDWTPLDGPLILADVQLDHAVTINAAQPIDIQGELSGAGSFGWSPLFFNQVGRLVIRSAGGYTGTINTTNMGFAATAQPTLVFDAGAGKTYSFSGAITGQGTVRKEGTGTTIWSGGSVNSHTGITSVDAGVLLLSRSVANAAVTGTLKVNAGATVRLGSTHQIADGSLVILDRGTLDLAAHDDGIGKLQLTGGLITGTGTLTVRQGEITTLAADVTSSIATPLDLFSQATVINTAAGTVPAAVDLAITGNILTGSINKTGVGTLQLSGFNAITSLYIGQGTVNVTRDAALGQLGTETLTLDGGTLKFASGFDGLSAGRTLYMGSTGGTVDTNGNTVVFGSAMTGFAGGTSGIFKKLGAGTLTLQVGNTFGGMELRGGTVVISADSGLGVATGGIELRGGILKLSAPVTFSSQRLIGLLVGTTNAAQLDLDGGIDTNGFDATIPGPLYGHGLTKRGAGTLTLSGDNYVLGTTSLLGGTLRISSTVGLGDGNAINLRFAGGRLLVDATGLLVGVVSLAEGDGIIDTHGNLLQITTDITGGGGKLWKQGAGEMRLLGSKSFTSSTLIENGSLSIDHNQALGTGPLAVSNGATLRFLTPMTFTHSTSITGGGVFDTAGSDVAVNATISGDSLTKAGAGTLRLMLNNSLQSMSVTGGMVEFSDVAQLGAAIILNGGGLRWAAGNSADLSSRLQPVGAAGTVLDTGVNTITLATPLVDTGLITKTGTGSLTLTGDSNFAGGLSVLAGIMTIQGGGAAWQSALSTAGQLVLNRSSPLTIAAVISGAGSVRQSGAGRLTLTAANTFAGGLTLDSGTIVELGSAGTLGANAVINNGALVINRSVSTTISNIISGSGSVENNGTGRLTLSAVNSFSGGLTIAAGGVEIVDGAAIGTGAVTNNSELIITRDTNLVLAVAISGSGRLEKNGAGTLSLSGTDTFTGGTTVNAGRLRIGAGGSSGTLSGNVILANSSPLEFDRGGTLTLAGIISGNGSLIKNGTGSLTLMGVNTFTGGIIVNAGIVSGQVQNLPGNVSGTGGTLRVDEGVSATWNVQVSGGVSLEFINTTSGFGVMNLNAATRLTHTGSTHVSGGVLVNLNAANTLSSLSPLTVNGQLDLAGGSQTVASLSGNGLIYSFNANPLTATLATGGDDASTTFSGLLADNTGFGAGKLALWNTGNGMLTLTNANTFTGGIIVSGNGTLYGTQAAAFSTTGDITLANGNLRTGVTMTFGTSRPISLQGSGNTFNVDAATRLTMDSVLSGTALLTKSGAGTLVLTSANTFSGGMRLVGGLIEFSTSANLGTGTLTPDGGGLRWTVGNTLDLSSRFASLGSGGGVFDTQSNNITFATALTGSGGLTKDGSGTLTLAVDPTYSGTTLVAAGRLIINGSPDGSIIVAAGAELEVDGPMTSLGLGGDGSVKLGSGTLTLNVAEGAFTSFNGVITTTGGVIKNGLGTQAFAGPNAFQNGVTLNAGVLQVNGDAGLGASSGFVHFNGGTLRWGLQFNLSSAREITLQSGGGIDTATYTTTITQGISGSGTLTKLGTGILALNGVNTFTGGIHLDNGILVGSTAALPGNIVITAPGLLSVQQNTDATWNASLSGSGRVELISPQNFGIIRLGAGQTHTHSGTTLIGAGLYLVAGGANSLSAASAHTINGGLDLNAATQTIGSLAGSGEVYSYSLTTATGTLITNGDGTSTTFSGLIKDNTGFDSGVLALVKNGAGTLTLTNTNTFSGGVTVNGGLIAFTSGVNLGTGRITLNGGGLKWSGVSSVDVSSRLNAIGTNGAVFDTNGNDITFVTALTGTGSITKLGAGSLTLPALTGNLQISQGGIILSGNDSYTYGGSITGIGFLQKVGTGTLTLTGANNLSGSFLINNGTVIASTTSLPGSVVTNDGTLRLVQTTDATYGGSIGGSGSFIKTGAGALTLTGYNTFTGDTQILGGTLVLTDANSVRNSTVKLDGGSLRWASGNTFSLYFSGGDSIGANGATFDTNGNNIVLDGRLYGSGGLTKNGAGTLTLPLSGYAGPTVVNGGTLVTNTLNLVQSASISIAAGAVLVLNQAGVNSIDMLIQNTTGAGSLTVTNSAVPLAILRLQSGAKLTHSGPTTINTTTALVIAPSSGVNALSTNSALTVNGILDLGGSNQSIPRLTGAGEIYSATAASSMATLTVAQANDSTFSGTLKDTVSGLQGVLALQKTGAGTLTLSGTSTYSGGTTVAAGTLVVNGTLTGPTTVQSGATLGGSGHIGALRVESGGTIAPGSSPGKLTLTDSGGGFDFQSGSTVLMELTPGGSSDQLKFIGNGVTSLLSFSSMMQVTFQSGTSPQLETFKLLDWSGLLNAPIFASHFSQNLIRDGSQDNNSAWDLPDLSSTTFYWDLSQFTTRGTIQIVPEPSRAALLMLSAGVMWCRRRRLR